MNNKLAVVNKTGNRHMSVEQSMRLKKGGTQNNENRERSEEWKVERQA